MVACQKRLDLLALESVQFLKFRWGISTLFGTSRSLKTCLLLIYHEIKFTVLVIKVFLFVGFCEKWPIYYFISGVGLESLT